MKCILPYRWLLAGGLCLGSANLVWSAPPPSSLPSPKSTVKASESKKPASESQKPANPTWFNWIGSSSSNSKGTSTSTDAGLPEPKSNLNPNDEREMLADLTRGKNYQTVGELEKARKIYEELRVRFPQEPEPAYHLGVIADMQRKHQQAEALFSFAVQQRPQNATYCGALGYCYFMQGKYRESEVTLIRAAHMAPKNIRIRNNLGLAMGMQGKYSEALSQFAACGSEADAYFNLAYIYALQDKTEESKQCFRKSLSIDPTHQKARDGLGAFTRYETLPPHLQKSDDYLDDRGVKWIPYVEPASGQVQAASAEMPAGNRSIGSAQRQLQDAARPNRAQNLQSQRGE